MAKNKITLEFTQVQLNALFELIEDTKAEIDCSDGDTEKNRRLRLIFRMLKANGYKLTQTILQNKRYEIRRFNRKNYLSYRYAIFN